MKSVLQICTFFILHFTFYIKSEAQSPILEQYIQKGLQSNLTLKQQNFELQKAVENIAIAKSMFAPKATFAPTYSWAGGGRSLDFPVGDMLNPVYSTLNQLTHTNNFPQISNVHALLAPNNFQDTKVSLSYPIFNTDIQYNYLISKQLLSVEEAKKRVLENELRYNITTAYLQYLQTLEAHKIYDNSKKVLEGLVVLNEKLVKNNVSTKDAVYSAQFEVSKIDYQSAIVRKNEQTAQAYFNFLLNKPLNSNIQVDTTLALFAKHQTGNLSAIKVESIQNRQEISQLSNSLEVSKTAVKLQEMNSKRPQIFAGGNTGFQGTGYKFSGQAYYVAQVGLVWDIFHGYEKKHKIQQAKIQQNQLEAKLEELKQQIQLQVSQAYFELEAAKLSLKTAEEGLNTAEKSFKIVDSRYRNGQAILIEFLKSQNDVTVANLQVALAKYDILIKQAALDKAMAVK